ncbi:POTE ankyrin domain family member A isoform X1 [Mus musculus]|uniref:POTE ankyrin domain family member A isoform X1 n=1 Tax=Mus musculus TaxID=10090 RepID=UPI0005AB9AB7|nr:POTE ankyrin domain family member A isoform X1 [Mus musculus]|eukprot:XP_011240461.1 PREDICTED: POTE ankyrin domain family member A isoform X1 [Mus musculus]
MSFSMKKIFGAKEKTPLGFCDAPQMTVSEFFFGENPNYPKYHTTYRPLGHIHRVAAEGDAARMEILLTLGQCNVYHRDRKDRTALHFACVYGRLPVVTILVKNNCEIDALDKNHTTPLMKSVQCWKQKCATVLLEHGADPNIRDSSGNSALHYAVYNGHQEMASLLLQYNADIEQKTKDGFTPLLLALREKRVEVAEFLVRMGADIHVVDELQRNTLIYAIRCGSKDLSVLLLEKGIDFFYKDVFGWTALRYAIEGHCTFRQTLLDFEESLHSNKKDKEPELQVEPSTSCILAKQIDAGNDSLARISSCPSPETPVLTMKEDENSDARSNSESKPPNCAGNSPAAIDKAFGNRGKRTVEAWVEKDPSSESAAEVRDSVTNEAVERIKLLPSETELELMSVEEDVSHESENDHPLRESEHLPKIKVGHSSRSGYQMGKMNINRQMKESDEEYAQLMTPIEMKDPVSKEPWTTKDAPTFKSEPDLEVTLKEDHNRFDDSRNIQSLRIREGPPNTSGNVSVAADPRRERTNRQAAESAKEYPPLMTTNEMKDPDKVVTMKEVGIVQLEGPAVKLTSEEEPNRQDGFERNPPSNICKQIPAQDVGYLSIAKHQRGEKMVTPREKEFSKECPQSKPTIVEEESVSKEAWDMTTVKSFLEDTSNDYPLSKPTVEKNDYVPNEVSDIKHGKWFQENCPKEYVQLKLPIEERDSFPREAPPVNQAKLHRADEPTSVKNPSRITRCVRQNAAASVKVTSVEDQKCPDDHEKNQRMAAFKRPQTKDTEYLSMANYESRENFAEDQEEDPPEQQPQWKPVQPTLEDSSPSKASAAKPVEPFLTAEPITNISEGKQEWCDSRNTQRQGIGNLFLAEDQRYDSSIQDEEEDFPEEYVQLKPLDKEKTPFPCEAPAKKEVKTFGTELDKNLSSEEEQGWLDDREEEHPKEPPPKDIVHLSMSKDEGGVNVVGVISSQEKDFPAECPEFKVSIEKQDFVPTEDSILDQEKSFLAGPKTEQLRWEEEQTGWRVSDKKQRKQAIFERLQLRRNTRVSIDPPKSVRSTRAAEDRGATTVQPRPEEDQTGWHAIDRKQQKPVFVRVQPRCNARTSMGPEESGGDTGAAQEKGATTVQLRPQEDQTGWHAIDKKQKPITERFQPRWNARVSLNPEESGENMGVAEEKGSTAVQPRPEEDQMRWGGSEKMQWKPVLERFQLKWSARVSVGPEKSRRHRGAGKDKVEPTVRVSSEQHSRCHSSVKKPRLHILERLQRKWSVRVCMETNQRGGKTKAAQMTWCPDRLHTRLRGGSRVGNGAGSQSGWEQVPGGRGERSPSLRILVSWLLGGNLLQGSLKAAF